MKHPIFVQKTMGGSAAGPPVDLATALTKEWSFDAHTVQYEGDVRLNKGEGELRIVVELYDFDNKDLSDAARETWTQACLAKLPAGFCGYRTAGGFRALTLRETPFIVNDAEQWEEWRQYHGGRAEALGAIIGAAPDHATDEPNRLFRLPMALREDGKPRYPELYGEIGYATLAPATYVRRAATEIYVDGDAGHSMVGAAFTAGGLVTGRSGQKLNVTCPWQHTHSGGKGGGTFVDDTEDHMGHFVCAHSHCQGRTSWDALDALRALPGVAAELAHWPEPTNVLAAYERVEEAEAPAPVAPPATRFIQWVELMEPLGEVPWLVPELEICPGRPPMFISDSGVGKTWALQSMALAVATGQPVFGRFACRKGPVLHLSRDSGLRATKHRYQRLARGMGISQADVVVFPHNLPLTDSKGQFLPKGLEEVNKEVARGGYALVILDSLAALCAGIDENSTDIGDPLRYTTDDSCVWLWAHHTTKSGEGYRGSGAIKAAAGAIYLGTREGDKRTWKPLKASEEHVGGTLPTFCTDWEVDEDGGSRVIALPEEQNETVVNEAQRAAWEMLKLVELHGKACTRDLLAAAGITSDVKGWNRQRTNAVLAHLAHPASGLLTRVEGDNYILAAGVVVPRAAHQIECPQPKKQNRGT